MMIPISDFSRSNLFGLGDLIPKLVFTILVPLQILQDQL